MPILEALGLRAVEEIPTALHGEGKVYIHDFGVLDARGAVLDLETEADRVGDAIAAVWRGDAESDSLNRLVDLRGARLAPGADPARLPQVPQRVSTRFTEEYRNDAFAENPHIAAQAGASCSRRSSTRLARRPAEEADGDPRSRSARTCGRWPRSTRTGSCAACSARSRRRCARTPTSPTGPRCRFKLRSADVPEMPKPYPLFEIFVYSPQMEAIHLRGGMVARGGIRWSDRKEDYRTEVLGLMKAQKVKNAVIVPDGSKGGFVLKRPTGRARGAQAPRSSTQYVTFMRGHAGHHRQPGATGEVVHPEGVRVLDGDDPYLVVAADKGTATFSDTANGVSERVRVLAGRRVRLGRHRGLRPQGARHHGARRVGVGEAPLPRARHRRDDRAVHGRRHRRHVGRRVRQRHAATRAASSWSPRSTTGTCSSTPTPTRRPRFAERQRLFDSPGSSWNDYDRSLLSPGGDVFDRKAKSVDARRRRCARRSASPTTCPTR